MSTSYTIIISAKRTHKQVTRKVQTKFETLTISFPELWDIIYKEDFGHPKLMQQYLISTGLLFKGIKSSTNIKIELYEGRTHTFDFTRRPMIIRSHILPGKNVYRPYVFLPNGNVQDLRIFLNHWQELLIAMGKDYNPKNIARFRVSTA